MGKTMGERKHNKTGRKKEEVVKLCGADPNESDDVPLQDIQHIYDFFYYKQCMILEGRMV